MNNVAIQVFPGPSELARAVAETFCQSVAILPAGVPFHMALSGGSTPRQVYETFAQKEFAALIPWERVHLFWGDERCVPPDDAQSNFRMARQALIDSVALSEANVHRMRGEDPPDTEARRYAGEIHRVLGAAESGLPRIDWLHLGLGEDGHIASIFPGADPVAEPQKICAVAEHPETGQKRITLTEAMLNRAKRVSFFVTGKNKAAVVADIMSGKGTYPALRVQPESGRLEWFLDAAAASGLSG